MTEIDLSRTIKANLRQNDKHRRVALSLVARYYPDRLDEVRERINTDAMFAYAVREQLEGLA